MQENNSPLEHLELVYEMNRLFLSFLKDRARRRSDCLGLTPSICTLLREAGEARLDQAAALPRALFHIDIDLSETAVRAPERMSRDVIALYSLQSKLLLSARNLIRQNAHLAQTFLGLPARTLIQLRCLALMELATLADTACVLAAGFEAEPWLWRELLCSENPLEQRRLRLIALQPRAADIGAAPQSDTAQRR